MLILLPHPDHRPCRSPAVKAALAGWSRRRPGPSAPARRKIRLRIVAAASGISGSGYALRGDDDVVSPAALDQYPLWRACTPASCARAAISSPRPGSGPPARIGPDPPSGLLKAQLPGAPLPCPAGISLLPAEAAACRQQSRPRRFHRPQEEGPPGKLQQSQPTHADAKLLSQGTHGPSCGQVSPHCSLDLAILQKANQILPGLFCCERNPKRSCSMDRLPEPGRHILWPTAGRRSALRLHSRCRCRTGVPGSGPFCNERTNIESISVHITILLINTESTTEIVPE